MAREVVASHVKVTPEMIAHLHSDALAYGARCAEKLFRLVADKYANAPALVGFKQDQLAAFLASAYNDGMHYGTAATSKEESEPAEPVSAPIECMVPPEIANNTTWIGVKVEDLSGNNSVDEHSVQYGEHISSMLFARVGNPGYIAMSREYFAQIFTGVHAALTDPRVHMSSSDTKVN